MDDPILRLLSLLWRKYLLSDYIYSKATSTRLGLKGSIWTFLKPAALERHKELFNKILRGPLSYKK